MSIKKTYFVPGTTTDKNNKLSTGWVQGELSKLGIQQAKDLGQQVSDQKFDIVFCSDLKRAVDSAQLGFSDKYKILADKRLRECNYGDLNQASEEKVKYTEHIDKPFPHGESLKDVQARINDFIHFIKENYPDKHIAIVAHKAPQLALEVLTKGKTWSEAIEQDWRKTKSWQAGWEYIIK